MSESCSFGTSNIPDDTQSMLPKAPQTYFQERQGILRVSTLLNAAGLIFRETPNADVGIDGHVELVNQEGEATGATIAAQIKSGKSYLKDGSESWRYYAEEKHLQYWEMYPLPVILMLHDPESDTVYWADIRIDLRSDQRGRSPLLVPKSQTLSADRRNDLFAGIGADARGLLAPIDALKALALTRNKNASFPLSHLDIFLEGLTDIGRKLFFSVGMCWDIAELLLPEDSPSGVGMGHGEQHFLDAYLRFLVEQSLAHIDYSDIMIDIAHRDMYPTLLVPLTRRGRTVRDLCRTFVDEVSPRAITEAPIGLVRHPGMVERTFANINVARSITTKLSGYT